MTYRRPTDEEVRRMRDTWTDWILSGDAMVTKSIGDLAKRFDVVIADAKAIIAGTHRRSAWTDN